MKKTYAYIFIFSLIILSLSFYMIYFVESNSFVNQDKAQYDGNFTVIIDAGHGGADGGAVGDDGTEEKEINLLIAQNVSEILSSYGVNVKMTRKDDNSIHSENAKTLREQKVSDIHNRMKFQEENQNSIFVSIHQNSFPDDNSHGAQMFYSPNDTLSPELADSIQKEIVNDIQPDNTRLIKKCTDSVYLIYNAKVPAVLVECGFMSNNNELKQLEDREYQRKIAFSVANGIMNYLNRGS